MATGPRQRTTTINTTRHLTTTTNANTTKTNVHLAGLLALHELDELLVFDSHLYQLHLVREGDRLQLRAVLLSLGHRLLQKFVRQDG